MGHSLETSIVGPIIFLTVLLLLWQAVVSFVFLEKVIADEILMSREWVGRSKMYEIFHHTQVDNIVVQPEQLIMLSDLSLDIARSLQDGE